MADHLQPCDLHESHVGPCQHHPRPRTHHAKHFTECLACGGLLLRGFPGSPFSHVLVDDKLVKETNGFEGRDYYDTPPSARIRRLK